MKKIKKLVVCMLLALAASFAFAEEAAKTEEAPKEKKDFHLYYGGELGVFSTAALSGCFTGFEVTPFIGIMPFQKLPDCSVEFALQMNFIQLKLSAFGFDEGKIDWNVISPQVLFGCKYDIGSFKPFIKFGAGLNINSAKFSGESLRAGASLGIVVNPGLEFAVNDKGYLIIAGRFNTNTTSISYGDEVLFDSFGCGTQSFVLGFRYNK